MTYEKSRDTKNNAQKNTTKPPHGTHNEKSDPKNHFQTKFKGLQHGEGVNRTTLKMGCTPVWAKIDFFEK